MSKRLEIVSSFYNEIDEDARLNRSRHGQMEYITTMHYINKYAKEGAKLLEIGAGTGRYSIALAKAGYDVTSVELVEHNLEVLKTNSKGLTNLQAYQGDALDLSRFADNTFDATLLFGPLYHLYEKEDVQKSIDEAIRVTKPDGIILVAFLSVYAILFDNYLNGSLLSGIEENFTEDYKTRHFEEQLFTGYDVAEFEELFADKPVEYLNTVAVNGILELAEKRVDFAMSDEEMEAFAKLWLAVCEKREMLGSSGHLLYICKKNE